MWAVVGAGSCTDLAGLCVDFEASFPPDGQTRSMDDYRVTRLLWESDRDGRSTGSGAMTIKGPSNALLLVPSCVQIGSGFFRISVTL